MTTMQKHNNGNHTRTTHRNQYVTPRPLFNYLLLFRNYEQIFFK